MNIKMATNSQLSTTESIKKKPKTKQKTKQTTRTGTESQTWRSHEGISAGGGKERMGEKVQGRNSIIGRH